MNRMDPLLLVLRQPWVLAALDPEIILLKGAAYLEAGLPCSQGRTLSDLDLLVRREELPRIEKTLQEAGWESDTEEEYDQRYYREWMHEIPPLKHRFRGLEVDIHHNLLALTGRYRVPAEKLWPPALQPLLLHRRGLPGEAVGAFPRAQPLPAALLCTEDCSRAAGYAAHL